MCCLHVRNYSIHITGKTHRKQTKPLLFCTDLIICGERILLVLVFLGKKQCNSTAQKKKKNVRKGVEKDCDAVQ